MSIVDKFGEKVGEIAENDPVKARKLLLAGYRLQEKRLALFPDRKLPMSGQYVAKIVMNNIIQALAKPENAAMVSIFVPGELLTAAGLTPYSVEALSCFIAGTGGSARRKAPPVAAEQFYGKLAALPRLRKRLQPGRTDGI